MDQRRAANGMVPVISRSNSAAAMPGVTVYSPPQGLSPQSSNRSIRVGAQQPQPGPRTQIRKQQTAPQSTLRQQQAPGIRLPAVTGRQSPGGQVAGVHLPGGQLAGMQSPGGHAKSLEKEGARLLEADATKSSVGLLSPLSQVASSDASSPFGSVPPMPGGPERTSDHGAVCRSEESPVQVATVGGEKTKVAAITETTASAIASAKREEAQRAIAERVEQLAAQKAAQAIVETQAADPEIGTGRTAEATAPAATTAAVAEPAGSTRMAAGGADCAGPLLERAQDLAAPLLGNAQLGNAQEEFSKMSKLSPSFLPGVPWWMIIAGAFGVLLLLAAVFGGGGGAAQVADARAADAARAAADEDARAEADEEIAEEKAAAEQKAAAERAAAFERAAAAEKATEAQDTATEEAQPKETKATEAQDTATEEAQPKETPTELEADSDATWLLVPFVGICLFGLSKDCRRKGPILG